MKIYLTCPITNNPDYINDLTILEEKTRRAFPNADIVNPLNFFEEIKKRSDSYEDYHKPLDIPYEVYAQYSINRLFDCNLMIIHRKAIQDNTSFAAIEQLIFSKLLDKGLARIMILEDTLDLFLDLKQHYDYFIDNDIEPIKACIQLNPPEYQCHVTSGKLLITDNKSNTNIKELICFEHYKEGRVRLCNTKCPKVHIKDNELQTCMFYFPNIKE